MNTLCMAKSQGLIGLFSSSLDCIGFNASVNAFEIDCLSFLYLHQVINLNKRIVTDEYAARIAAGLESLGYIHFTADDGVAQALFRPEIAHISEACIDTNTDDKRVFEAAL